MRRLNIAAQIGNWANVIQEFIADKYQLVGVTEIYTLIIFKCIAKFKAIYSDLQRLQAIGRWLI